VIILFIAGSPGSVGPMAIRPRPMCPRTPKPSS